MRVTATYELKPLCPKCLRPLETPEYWLKVPPDERYGRHTTYCRECNTTVEAAFYEGRIDR